MNEFKILCASFKAEAAKCRMEADTLLTQARALEACMRTLEELRSVQELGEEEEEEE